MSYNRAARRNTSALQVQGTDITRRLIVLMAHELQHVIELTRGLNFPVEAARTGSGVWRTLGGYETQAAVDISRQVANELRAYASARK